jgi:hypothetical protein
MRVLFIMERYCDADPDCGPTNSEHLLVDSLKSTGLVSETSRFYFDQLSKQFGKGKMSELLFEHCNIFQPNLVIFTPLGGALGDRLNPPGEVIKRIGIRTILWMFDCKPACGIETKWLPYVDYLCIADSIAAYHYYKDSPKIILTYSAASPTLFFNRNLERNVDVSFVGSVDPSDVRWPMRQEYTSFLRGKGIGVVVAGGQRSGKLTPEEYATLMCRSKISLNFCRDGNGLPCLKPRAFEVASCGALLMEDWDTEVARLLEPSQDFVIFQSKEELMDLVRYYLKHVDEREAIAVSGWQKTTGVYSARNMWGYLFERMGFEIPKQLQENSVYLKHKSIMEKL